MVGTWWPPVPIAACRVGLTPPMIHVATVAEATVYVLAKFYYLFHFSSPNFQISKTPISRNPCLGKRMFPAKWFAVVSVTEHPPYPC